MIFACGEIGLKYKDFLNLDFRTFDNIVKGYDQKQQRLKRDSWEQTRLIVAFSLLPYTPKNQQLTPKEIMPLPWDNENTVDAPELTQDETLELLQKSAEFWKEQDNKNTKKDS